jgi:transcription elongation factor GreA
MPATFLTKEGYQKLQDELDHLRTVKREEIALRLHEAMEDGDLIENAEYEAAKNEQAFTEGRIKELERILANARIISELDLDPFIVEIGNKVTIQEEDMEPEVFTIVGAAESDPRKGKISNESPLGKAVLNHRAGDVVQVDAPEGSYKVRIIKVD